jgi:two-component system nitrate/nitrite sensor histidine kinase NarX
MPIGDAVDRYGVLALEVTPKYVLERRQQRLLDTFASLLAVTIGNLLRSRRQRRVALMEERAAIARELHDSLAQTLSFVKIQLARMQAQARHADFAAGFDARDWDESLAELRLGVDSAYRNLRQLLSAFRSSVGAGGLAQSLQVIVDDLSGVTRTSIELDCRVQEIDLSPEEELHLLQIAREALSNVVRHARANHARVSVSESGGELTLSVLDDGEGFATDAADPAGHYGLSIMRERSERLGGRIEIGATNHPLAGAAAGSEVRLKFRPGSSVVS